jgi:iron(III) transport system permease protein
MPPLQTPKALVLGSARVRGTAAILLAALILAPIAVLIWKLGLTGYPPVWQPEVAWHYLQSEAILNGQGLGLTLTASLATGAVVASLALIGCWLARDSRWFRWLWFSVLIWVWVLPGPAVGIGLHEIIMNLVALSPDGPLAMLLYRGPSPAPVMWVQAVRSLPIAAVFLWPVVRMIPREWFEEARLGGAGALSEFMHVVAPMTWRAAALTMLAASALCLGEVAASGRVNTPGWQPYALVLLDRMHRGVDNTVAALCLLLLASLLTLGTACCAILRRWRS